MLQLQGKLISLLLLLARNWLCIYHSSSSTESLNCGLNCVITVYMCTITANFHACLNG